jgi:signal transduction histidine kinase
MLLILLAGLLLLSFIVIANDYVFINQLHNYNIEGSAVGEAFLFRSSLIMLFIVISALCLFIEILQRGFKQLEIISFDIDRIMDGEFPANIPHDSEEGILSRLEAQFAQMSSRLQLDLEQINSEKENVKALVTDITHQIKTPLASIKIFNSLLLDGGLTMQETNEFLIRTKEAINKLEWLSDSLIKISRMEAGMIRLKQEKADIRSTVLDAVNGVYLKALQKNIEVRINDLESIYLPHDVRWTKEALFNVLDNAVKYTPDQGRIQVAIGKLESYIEIDIEDNGVGIPPAEIGHIFDRFYRGRSAIVQQTAGTGVGLYLARKILEAQNGGIIVSSEAGKGSKFTVLLTLRNC